ncbi:MAG: hypothetical protein BWK76_10655 [Desulfobulbaceae bacterium A2]|nr:MAG: hypothetical protein BWK76_10655 [Desulfobulbaceae bacterium A2]
MTPAQNPIIDRVDKKLALSFGALTLVLMLLVTGVSSYLFTRLQSREEDRLAGALARIVGESVSKVSFSGTYHARLFVEEIKAKTPEIDAVSVESLDGRIIAHSDPGYNGRPLIAEDLAMLRKSLAGKTIVVSERTTPRGSTEKIVVLPYGGGIDADIVGVIRLVVNVDKTRQDQQSGIIGMLLIATLLSCAAVIVILLLSRHFGSAVKELAVQLQAILDNSPALIYVKDRSGRYQFVNRAWYELFRTSNENVKGKTDLDLFPETIARQFMANDRLVMASDTALTLEEQTLVEDELRFYHSNKVAVRDADGATYGLCGISTDITGHKQVEEALRESEQKVRRKLDAILSPEADVAALELSDIIDTEKIQRLMDDFYRLTHIGIGIIDLKGKVLVGTGWQDICTTFHRANPESCRLCIESDLELSRNVPAGTFKLYRCKNNMWDMATPIMLGNRQVGNIFLGQFLFDDEHPDYEVFRQQAQRYGFNEQEYLAAFDRVPRWSRETVDAAMSFYAVFAVLIGNLSYSTIKLASALEERKRAEAALQHLNRELRAISDCNQVLVRADNEQTLLDEICRIVCDEAGYRMAWVGYPEDDENRSVRAVAWAGVEGGDLAAADVSWADTERGRGAVGVAVRCGSSECIQDIATDPRMAPWRESALQRGYRAAIALPLKDENAAVFGVLVIYSSELNAFTPDETRLMEELAGDLAFGIQALRNRILRKESERSIALLSFALNSVQEAAFLIDEQARFRYVNEESCRALGYERNELLTLGVADVDPGFPPERWPEHWAGLKESRSLTFEGCHKAKNGTVFPVEISANYLEYDGRGYNLALVRDITGRKAAEESLRETAIRLNEAQRIAHMGSWELDLRTNHLVWSDEIYRIYEIEPGAFDATYEAFLRAAHPDDREAVNAAYLNSLKTRTSYSIDHRLLLPDGRIKYVHEQCETFYEIDEPLRSVGTVQDITDQKLVEERLRNISEELEQRVRERTAELESKNSELERINRLFVGRELRMVELKERLKEVERQLEECKRL